MLLQKDFPEVVPFQNDFHVSSSHLSGFDCSILLALSKTQMEQEKKMLPACIKFIQTLEVKMRWAFALFFWLPCFAKGEYFLFGLVARESDFFFPSFIHEAAASLRTRSPVPRTAAPSAATSASTARPPRTRTGGCPRRSATARSATSRRTPLQQETRVGGSYVRMMLSPPPIITKSSVPEKKV